MLIESVTTELPDTKTLRLKWPDGHNPEFLTGQFITVYWPDTPGYKRAYSLSSCALDRGAYEVTVKRDGKMGTRVVDWAKAGDKMFVLPPAGKGTMSRTGLLGHGAWAMAGAASKAPAAPATASARRRVGFERISRLPIFFRPAS